MKCNEIIWAGEMNEHKCQVIERLNSVEDEENERGSLHNSNHGEDIERRRELGYCNRCEEDLRDHVSSGNFKFIVIVILIDFLLQNALFGLYIYYYIY